MAAAALHSASFCCCCCNSIGGDYSEKGYLEASLSSILWPPATHTPQPHRAEYVNESGREAGLPNGLGVGALSLERAAGGI